MGEWNRAVRVTGASAVVVLASVSLPFASETPVDQVAVETQSASKITAPLDAPIQVIVSRKDQSLRVFRGREEIATSKVSTGKAGHTTPTGIFSILEKRKRHFSNLYNSAPMPYMQRLTWSGIALHESNSVPDYPASHGCVRLPNGFAKQLFEITSRGAHVVIAERDTAPQLIHHSFLFQPEQIAPIDQISALSAAVGPQHEGLGKISLLSDRPAQDPAHAVAKRLNKLDDVRNSDKPLRIFITRQAKGNLVREVQALLNELGFDAGVEDGLAGKDTLAAVKRFRQSRQGSLDERVTGTDNRINQALLQALYDAAGKGEVPTGHLFVRHNFKPLFDAPIQITQPNKPLGAHLFTANGRPGSETRLDWLSVNLGDKFTEVSQNRLGLEQDFEESGLVASHEVLDRIIVPQSLRVQINHLIKTGASLTISDRGISPETTQQGTDFIVLTKPTVPSPSKVAAIKAKSKKVTKPRQVKKKSPASHTHKTQMVSAKKPQRARLFQIFRRDGESQLVSVSN